MSLSIKSCSYVKCLYPEGICLLSKEMKHAIITKLKSAKYFFGVQTRGLQEFPRAVFNPFGSHSLNWIIAGGRNIESSQHRFSVFSNVYIQYLDNVGVCMFTACHLSKCVKHVWKSRIHSDRYNLMQAVRYQYTDVQDALVELAERVVERVNMMDHL